MRKIFKDIDLDKSGKINKNELASGLRAVGLVMSGHQINSIMRLFDKDGSGQLSYPEFVRMLGFVSNHNEHRPTPRHSSTTSNKDYSSKVTEQPRKRYQQVSQRSAMRKIEKWFKELVRNML